MGCPFSPAGAVRDPRAQPESPVAPPAPGTSPRVFLEETTTGGITSPHLPDPPSPVRVPRKAPSSHGVSGTQIIVPCLAEGEILQHKFMCNYLPRPQGHEAEEEPGGRVWTPCSPHRSQHTRTGTGPHRQGQGGDATRAPSRRCWGRWMSSRLFIKPASCCGIPWPGSPLPPSSHPPSLAPCIPPRAWHSRSTALQTPLLNPNLLRDCQAFPDRPIDPEEPPIPQPWAHLAGTAPSPLPLIQAAPAASRVCARCRGALFGTYIFNGDFRRDAGTREQFSRALVFTYFPAQAGEGFTEGARQTGRKGALCFVSPGPNYSLKGEEPIRVLPSPPASPGCNYSPRQAQQDLEKKTDLKSFTNDH